MDPTIAQMEDAICDFFWSKGEQEEAEVLENYLYTLIASAFDKGFEMGEETAGESVEDYQDTV